MHTPNMVVLQCFAIPTASGAVRSSGAKVKKTLSWTRTAKRTSPSMVLGRDGLHVEVVERVSTILYYHIEMFEHNCLYFYC